MLVIHLARSEMIHRLASGKKKTHYADAKQNDILSPHACLIAAVFHARKLCRVEEHTPGEHSHIKAGQTPRH
jgi:hypothetical protein